MLYIPLSKNISWQFRTRATTRYGISIALDKDEKQSCQDLKSIKGVYMWDSFQCFKYQLKASITTKGLDCAIQAKDFIQTHVRRKFEENNFQK